MLQRRNFALLVGEAFGNDLAGPWRAEFRRSWGVFHFLGFYSENCSLGFLVFSKIIIFHVQPAICFHHLPLSQVDPISLDLAHPQGAYREREYSCIIPVKLLQFPRRRTVGQGQEGFLHGVGGPALKGLPREEVESPALVLFGVDGSGRSLDLVKLKALSYLSDCRCYSYVLNITQVVSLLYFSAVFF